MNHLKTLCDSVVGGMILRLQYGNFENTHKVRSSGWKAISKSNVSLYSILLIPLYLTLHSKIKENQGHSGDHFSLFQ